MPSKALDFVIVTTKTGFEIKGVLRDEAENALVLTSAAQSGTDQNGRLSWKPLAGEVVIPMANVDYFQRTLPAEIISMLET